MLPSDSLHCLIVDFAHAPAALRAAFAFSSDELQDLLCLAGRDGLPLMLLRTSRALTLISTGQHHVRAFRPVLARVRERTQGIEGWRALPTRIASGCDAARQVLLQALPGSGFAAEFEGFTRSLRSAAEQSSTCRAFSAELRALVRMTEHAAARLSAETRLALPVTPETSNETDSELETLAAQRILEEELVAWQSSYPALRSSRRPVADSDIGQFTGEERQSMVRIRVASVLSKLRTA